ncbi:hypothetical protein, partial [Serratia symbiotica]|uniref:hypothetical protein n=1 Tax=Serratia symbiotica TaxID=138074 RepID=UPI001E57DE58
VRLSSEALKLALANGLQDAGADVPASYCSPICNNKFRHHIFPLSYFLNYYWEFLFYFRCGNDSAANY